MSTVDKQTAPKFKVGDLVEVTARHYTHDLPIGYINRITNVQREDDGDYSYWLGSPDDDDNPSDLVSENEIELAAPKFKVGELVRITGNTFGHSFDIGEIVEVVAYSPNGDGDDYKCKSIQSGRHYWIGCDDGEDPCDLVSENEIKLAVLKFQAGDLVRIITEKYGHEFKIGELVQVMEFSPSEEIELYKCESLESGDEWWVGIDEGELLTARPETYITTTSQLIQTIRRAHGWSQRQLAELCEGLHQPNVSVLEKLDAPPTVELLSKLVKATGIGWGIAIQPSGAIQIFPESDFYDSAISAILEEAKADAS